MVVMVEKRDENLGIEESGVCGVNACWNVEYCQGLESIAYYCCFDTEYERRWLVDDCR